MFDCTSSPCRHTAIVAKLFLFVVWLSFANCMGLTDSAFGKSRSWKLSSTHPQNQFAAWLVVGFMYSRTHLFAVPGVQRSMSQILCVSS